MCFTPKIPPPPSPVKAQDVNQAALNQRTMLAGAKGQASTILTSPLGAQSTPGQPKTMLGA